MLKSTIKVISQNDNILRNIDKILPNAMEEVLKKGQELALKNKRGNKDQSLIQYEIKNIKTGVEGRIFTTFDYAPFLEYGTGEKADGTMPHIGKTKTFKESGMKYWYIPKAVADKKGMIINSSRLINIKGELFYIMYATQPYPFMRPTAFELETISSKILAEYLRKNLRK